MTALTAKGIREVGVWMTGWRGNDEVNIEIVPEPRITVYRDRGVLVYGADSIRRLALH